ncbi:phosphatidate cytidylyltransferase [Helicobacter sp. 13S00401-1]|uniref:phosphatidate cytidylyltransferase n=1 Tax=Helicobacter sp. 13S00401-1 TaxID=1905758 RepID=UPI0015566205|nr:phosphatidate cytidylyltransferase [Helicobacter sp. 13S00401-1]
MSSFKELLKSSKNRLITGVILIIALIIILWIDNLILTWAILGIIFLIGMQEACVLYKTSFNIQKIIISIVIWVVAYFVSHPVYLGIFAWVLLSGIKAFRGESEERNEINEIKPFLYPSVMFLALYDIYANFGTYAFVWLIVVVALTDTLAYIGGRQFGKHKLTKTSPNKTIEGTIIGVIIGSAIGSLVGLGVVEGFWVSLVFSFIISVLSVLGDIYESFLKRSVDVKDSGSLLPGHGGVLDRLDGLLFGAIAMLLVFYVLV